MSSLFSRIIRGEIPSYRVYENEYIFAFLDIFPVRLGHTLVVPKVEIDYFVDVPEPHYTAVFQAAKILAPAIQAATACRRIGTAVIGLEVPHFHYHLIPLWKLSDISFEKKMSPTPQELAAMQKKILEILGK